MTKLLLFCLALVGCMPTSAQVAQIPAGTPRVVVRRISQALWPHLLFDSLGVPEPPFNPIGVDPVYGSLRISRSSLRVRALPGVTFHAGTATHNCFDCGWADVAVAIRADTAVTLQGPADIARLAPAFGTQFTAGDSAGIKDFVIEVMDASNLLGGHARLLAPGDPLSHEDSVLATPIGRPSGEWRRPRSYNTVTGEAMTLNFLVVAPSHGIWEVEVTQGIRRPFLLFSITQSARLGLWP